MDDGFPYFHLFLIALIAVEAAAKVYFWIAG
jgi:hypothetical protein